MQQSRKIENLEQDRQVKGQYGGSVQEQRVQLDNFQQTNGEQEHLQEQAKASLI